MIGFLKSYKRGESVLGPRATKREGMHMGRIQSVRLQHRQTACARRPKAAGAFTQSHKRSRGESGWLCRSHGGSVVTSPLPGRD